MSKKNDKRPSCDKKGTIFIDLDGTLFDTFKACDKKIIKDIFKGNSLVMLLDNLLWKINSLDFLPNSMWILKLRLLIYSIISFSSYNRMLNEYGYKYKEAVISAVENMFEITELGEFCKEYDIVIVTNNSFSVSIGLEKYFDNIMFCKNSKVRYESIKDYLNGGKAEYMVGNNYMDDIRIAKKLGIKSIYVGKNPVKCYFKADISIPNFVSALANIRYDEVCKNNEYII